MCSAARTASLSESEVRALFHISRIRSSTIAASRSVRSTLPSLARMAYVWLYILTFTLCPCDSVFLRSCIRFLSTTTPSSAERFSFHFEFGDLVQHRLYVAPHRVAFGHQPLDLRPQTLVICVRLGQQVARLRQFCLEPFFILFERLAHLQRQTNLVLQAREFFKTSCRHADCGLRVSTASGSERRSLSLLTDG